jgi:hypothetical protein
MPGFFLFHEEEGSMKKNRIAVATVLALGLLVGGLAAAEKIKSGPQVGKPVPGPFHPLNVTGEKAGKKFCLFCKNGENPVAMIFAREVSKPLTKLIKKIDGCTAKNSKCDMGSFVVFLNDTEGLDKKLKSLADQETIKHTVLSIDNPAGPEKYNVSRDADVTVVLYTDRTVKANYAFKKGALKDEDIDKIIADVKKILPEKKE